MPKKIFIRRIVPIMRYVSDTTQYETYSDATATTPTPAFDAEGQPYPLTVQDHYYFFRIEGRGFNRISETDLSKIVIKVDQLQFETVEIDRRNTRTLEVKAKMPDDEGPIDVSFHAGNGSGSGNSSEIEVTITAEDDSETEGGLYP